MSDSDSDNIPITQSSKFDDDEDFDQQSDEMSFEDDDLSPLILTDDSSDEKPITKGKADKIAKRTVAKKRKVPKKKTNDSDDEDEMADFIDEEDDDGEAEYDEEEQPKKKRTTRKTASKTKAKAKSTTKSKSKSNPKVTVKKEVKVKNELDDMEEEEEFDFSDKEESVTSRRSTKRTSIASRTSSKRRRIKEEDVETKVNTILNKAKTTTKKVKVLTPVQLLDRAVQAYKWWEQDQDSEISWTTLQHNGVIFQPPYQPHGVPLYYNGKPVKLTPEQEEIATLYAMVGEDAIQLREPESAKIFNTCFFNYFKEEMGAGSIVKHLDKCDFSAIRRYLDERKKSKVKTSAEEKQQLQLKMGYMVIDGNVQKTSNFLVEPPSLFRGRGLHPKMGSVKMRVIPEQVELNVDTEMVVPACSMKGHNWETLCHKQDVSWIAHWTDNIQNLGKYVTVNGSSFLKGQHDKEKYETARRLKKCICMIRTQVLTDLHSKSMRERQLATAIWIIDKLALRVGNEKSEEEADTVGCCSLRVEHLTFTEPYELTMDFLAKDSMPYHQTINLAKYEGGKRVYKNLKLFCKDKSPDENVFNSLTTSSLNAKLTSFMPGLTAKVFRTFNASVTLEKQLHKTYPEGTSIDEMVMQYNDANRKVAILCNHQRTVPKNWEENTAKKQEKLDILTEQVNDLKKMLSQIQKGKEVKLMPEEYRNPIPKVEITDDMDEETIKELKQKRQVEVNEKSKYTHLFKTQPTEDQVAKRLETYEARLASFTIKLKDLNANKQVALGTSKINYMDPRITVAWCKRNNVPIEKIFTTTLRNKHNWAMCVPESYRF